MSQQCSSVMADDMPSDIHALNIRCAVSWTLPQLMISVRVMCTDIISLQVERQHIIGRVGGNDGSLPAFFIWALWGMQINTETVSQTARRWMNAHSAFLIIHQNKCFVFSKWSFFSIGITFRSSAIWGLDITAFHCIFNNVGPGSQHVNDLETRDEGRWIFFANTDKNIRYSY